MKSLTIAGLLLLLNSFPGTAVEEENIIIPGLGIGKVQLGMTNDEVYKLIGQPQHAEGAMGRAFESWLLSGKAKLSVDFKRDHEGHRYYVRQLRIDSPEYVVSEKKLKLSVASKLDEIWKAFPNAAYVSTVPTNPGDAVEIYADVKAGIAFEIRREPRGSGEWGRCRAIIIYAALTHMGSGMTEVRK